MANKVVSELIDLSKIVADENQPRRLFEVEKLRDLKDSVKKYGVMRPLTVEKIGDKYLIIDGERRFRVAKELKLGEVPAVVISPQNPVDRLVQQFHLQEQHADWTPTEKAITVFRLSTELGVGLKEICTLLAIPERTASRYVAFADIVDKKSFEKNEIGIDWAAPINFLKRFTKKLYMEKVGEDFTRTMEKGLENTVIRRIKEGELKRPNDLTRIRDSFMKDPAYIEKFIETDITTDAMFLKTKARGAFFLRNGVNNAMYMKNNLIKFMELMDVKLNDNQINTLKTAQGKIKELLDRVEN